MGACVFETISRGRSAREAFDVARDRAAYERGHGGYTGTIAEKSSFTVIKATPTSKSAASELVQKLLDSQDPRIDDKWGPAGCIKLEKKDEFLFFGWASS